MENAGAAFVFPVLALALAFAALHLSTVLNSQRRAGAKRCGEAETSLLDRAAKVVLLPLATLLVLFFAVALIYHPRMSRRIAAAAGNARRSVSALVMFLLCVSTGTLEHIVFGQAARGGGGAGHAAQTRRALGMAALRALPGAATVTFFCGMMLIVARVAHVPAGGEAAGGAAVARDGRVQAGAQRLLTKVAAGAAAALVGLMAAALTLYGAKY